MKLILTLALVLSVFPSAYSADKPNIVLIFADDLGYGDIGCYNPDSRIPTPHIDQLASEGIRFTDAHSADSVCTPSRYGLLTGRYCWRTRLKTQVFFNWEPPLIEPGRETLASFLKRQGYRTAIAGKWHLGLGFTTKPGRHVDFNAPLPWYSGPEPDRDAGESIDFSARIFGGPEELGFDDAFYTAGCSTAQEPYCFIDNGRMLDMEHASYRAPANSRRKGMTSPSWDNDTVDVKFTERAAMFIEKHEKLKTDAPFFVYLPLSSPHSPHVTVDFALGKSDAGVRGDMVWLVDWAVGQIDTALKKHGVKDDTLVIVTSDNGPLIGSLKPAAPEGSAKVSDNGHLSMGSLRGQKGKIWEGGHRVPFVARWPDRIPGGVSSDYAFCFTDLLATFADLTGEALPEGAGEDSVSLLPALLGKSMSPRPPFVNHSNNDFALRSGKWKIVFGKGENPTKPATKKGQLFNLEADLGETKNLWSEEPELVKELISQFETIVGSALDD